MELKVVDFGMSRVVNDGQAYSSKNETVPLKWMAPESIHQNVFTKESDGKLFGRPKCY